MEVLDEGESGWVRGAARNSARPRTSGGVAPGSIGPREGKDGKDGASGPSTNTSAAYTFTSWSAVEPSSIARRRRAPVRFGKRPLAQKRPLGKRCTSSSTQPAGPEARAAAKRTAGSGISPWIRTVSQASGRGSLGPLS